MMGEGEKRHGVAHGVAGRLKLERPCELYECESTTLASYGLPWRPGYAGGSVDGEVRWVVGAPNKELIELDRKTTDSDEGATKG